jgi:hypothetical protein
LCVDPSTVVTLWHEAEGPYWAQSAFDEHTVQQMSAPALFAAHHIANGEFGQPRLEVHRSEHQP